MHDKIFKQGTCRGGWSFDCVPQPHELSSEANQDFEGYSDCERADYWKIKWNLSFILIRIFVKIIIICEYLEADETYTCMCPLMLLTAREKEKKQEKNNREAEKYKETKSNITRL